MKITKTPLARISENPANPRTISDDNLRLLVNSILEFPKMLEIRPLVTDTDGLILGGNMRYKALQRIAGMEAAELRAVIGDLRSFRAQSADVTEQAISKWQEWLKAPFAYVVEASSLTDAERKEFVIKDNISFGQWDWDALDNFSQEDLQDWGVQTWVSRTSLSALGNSPLTPAETSTDSRGRIIIIFPRERRGEVEHMLRLPHPSKPVYKVGELLTQPDHEDSI